MGTGKNPAAVALGRKGGQARAKALTKDELSRIGKKAVAARWAKRALARSAARGLPERRHW